MKILISADLHWPTINGVAVFSRNLAKAMADRGHEVLVIAPSQTGKRYKEVDGNYVIERTVSVQFPLYQKFRISPTPQIEARRIIKRFKPDVIHIQMLMWIGQATMRYGNKLGIPIVSTNHAIPENLMDNIKMLAPVSRPINYMLREYGARFHSRADYLTMPTQAAIDMLKASDKISKVPLEAVSNGIDLSRFKPGKTSQAVKDKFRIPSGVPIVSYVGRVDTEKHVNVLVYAFKEVIKEHPKAHLVIVGGGTEVENLQELVYELDLVDDVTLTGRVSDEELVELHRLGDVYCMPSPAELQCIAMMEAMASGKPVVAVDAGALKELCQDGRNGYLCHKDDEQEIARSIIKILGDDKMREKMGKESIAIAKTHDIKYTMDRFEEIYKSLVKS